MNKKVFISLLVVILLAAGAGFWFITRNSTEDSAKTFTANVETKAREFATSVALPEPLRYKAIEKPRELSLTGVLAETNRYRSFEMLPPLTLNKELTKGAEKKLQDMFDKQYFAHQSPDGKGPAQIADAVGYKYLTIGENLALGNFGGDSALVKAWMDSPGHRANILNKKYKEIGIAVGEGIYEGEHIWLAVQEFGVPASLCTAPERSLELLVSANKQEISEIEKRIDEQQRRVNETEPKNGPAYNREAAAYNSLVEQYNDLSSRTKKLVEKFNTQVETYNQCLRSHAI